MAQFRWKVTGDKQTIRLLNDLPKKIRRKVVAKGLRAGAKVLKDSVAAEAPRDTGYMAEHVKVRAGKRTRKGTVKVQVLFLAKDFEVTEGDKHGYYPAPVEYGDSEHAPDPFMARGFDAGESQATAVAMAEMRAGIDREIVAP